MKVTTKHRLRIWGHNPATGDETLLEEVTSDEQNDLIRPLIESLFSGTVIATVVMDRYSYELPDPPRAEPPKPVRPARATAPERPRRRGRRSMSPAERKQVSKRMKRYWRQRRAEAR